MADFYEVWRGRGLVLEKLEIMLEAREAAREQELKAATDIKRVYQGKVRLRVSWALLLFASRCEGLFYKRQHVSTQSM